MRPSLGPTHVVEAVLSASRHLLYEQCGILGNTGTADDATRDQKGNYEFWLPRFPNHFHLYLPSVATMQKQAELL
jgi:hypothetical protein